LVKPLSTLIRAIHPLFSRYFHPIGGNFPTAAGKNRRGANVM
jgi:hypothetical protein